MSDNIAIFGDVHGHHDLMAQAVLRWQEQSGDRIDLILCVGDFQALRDETDMRAMACPAKYQRVGDYPAYHIGQKTFPTEIIFIGGNHEAYNWLETMPAGGYLDPMCYYLGRWGVVERLGLRIGGLTGNHSPKAYLSGRKLVDYTDTAVLVSEKWKKQSTYFAEPEVEALAEQSPIDVLLLHDWPACLAESVVPGTTEGSARHGVGNERTRWLLEQLKPRWAFCGHMHRYFRGDIVWAPGVVTTIVSVGRVAEPVDRSMCVLLAKGDRDACPWVLAAWDDSVPRHTHGEE